VSVLAEVASRLRRWGLRVPLRVYFALLMVLSVAVLGGVNRFYLETRLLEVLEGELEMRALDLARYLGADSLDLVLHQDVVALQEVLSDARRNSPDVVYAFVTDPTGQVLAHTFESDFPNSLRFLNHVADEREYQVRTVRIFGERFRDFAIPLHDGDVGVLRLGVRDGRILNQVALVRRELMLFLLAAAVVSAIAAYLLTYFRLRPLATVIRTLEQFEPGKHFEPIAVRRRDEVADLAAKVNDVMARLDASHRQMRHTEKLVAAGMLASGLAHEINNPLSGLQNCVRRIVAVPGDARQIEEYADAILDATAHIERVVGGLLDFSRSAPRKRGPSDFRDAVGKGLDLTTFRLEKNGIQLVQRAPDEPVPIFAAEAQIVQVVVNIVLNAVDAMPAGGRLDVILTREGSAAVLRITDTGYGIAAEQLPRVFEPFFTTKEVGKGTGLGLAVTHSIVTEHGGRVEIHSTPGRGTEVNISLPLYLDGEEWGNVDAGR
jgi:two-component system NtrC family sensor kinase